MVKLDSKTVSKVAGLIQVMKIVQEEIENGFIYFIEDNDIKVHAHVKKILKDLFTLKLKDFLSKDNHKTIYDYLINIKSPAEFIQLTYPENVKGLEKFENDFENFLKSLLSSIGDEDEIEEIFEEYYKDTIIANTISFLESLGIIVQEMQEDNEDKEDNEVQEDNEVSNELLSNEEVLINRVYKLENEVQELKSIINDLINTLIEEDKIEKITEIENKINEEILFDPKMNKILQDFFNSFN